VDVEDLVSGCTNAVLVSTTCHVLADRSASDLLHRRTLDLGLISQRAPLVVVEAKRHGHAR
jgi:hypothetical protein